MQSGLHSLDSDFSFQMYAALSGIDQDLWDSIDLNKPFFQSHAFLSAIENIHPEIQFRYVLVYKEGQVIAALYTQLLDFSFKNLVNYSEKTSNFLKVTFRNYMAEKKTKLLNLGNVFFTGDKGIICKSEGLLLPYIPQIFHKIYQSFKKNKPSAFLIANIYLEDEKKCLSFYNNAFHPFVTDPDIFMSIDSAWKDFGGYMDALSSKYRVRAKKVLTVSTGITSKNFSSEELRFHKTDLLKLYNNVVNHVAFNMAVLNIDFFEEMKSVYRERCSILGYFKDNELVSFVCLFNVDVDTMHVHYIGLDYGLNSEFKIYNRMLLDFVRIAIENKKKYIHFGRTATEIKTTIGAVPKPLHAYIKMNNGLVNASLPYFLKRIRPPEYTARNPFK
jgi:hypothetical protein